ncbi:MAG: hypothetical protein EB027_01130 [Actinobacteria bacterium]|nr:hypothetical protein [Actinomycetota bacterium]
MSLPALRQLRDGEHHETGNAYAVTEQLCQSHGVEPEDSELAEFIAMTEAARSAAAELGDDLGGAVVVIAAADVEFSPSAEGLLGEVLLSGPLGLKTIASFHVAGGADVAATVSDGGSFDAADLAWWAVQELPDLIHHIESKGRPHG